MMNTFSQNVIIKKYYHFQKQWILLKAMESGDSSGEEEGVRVQGDDGFALATIVTELTKRR
jgi:hypothetical protein